jgi:ribosomal protein S11
MKTPLAHPGAIALRMIVLALTALQSLASSTYEPYTFTTIAGKAGSGGNADGTGSAARFNLPIGVAVDSAGNLYVSDWGNSTIRKVTPVGTNWVVTTLAGKAGVAGSADGTNSAARFGSPCCVAVDSTGNVYVADTHNDTIRKVTPVGTNWVVTTLAGKAGIAGSADGTNSAARFDEECGVAVDNAGTLYVADFNNNTIRKVTPVGTNWVVTTLAGKARVAGSADGTNSAARFYGPNSVAVDGAGNVYVADQFNDTVRKVTPVGTNWVVTTLAGKARVAGSADGTNSAARFNWLATVGVDGAGSLYVADSNNDTIRKISPEGTNWVVTTLAGKAGNAGSAEGTGSVARFYFASTGWVGGGVAVDSAGNLFVVDSLNHTIRKGHRPLAITSSGASFGFIGGQFGFSLTGPAWQSVVVETSTDLLSWLPLWTNTFTGTLQFSDPLSGGISHRFYRARLP